MINFGIGYWIQYCQQIKMSLTIKVKLGLTDVLMLI